MKHTLKKAFVVVVIILVSAFIMHAVVPHEHTEEIFGTGIQAALHGEDKKWWLLLLLSFFGALGGSLKNRMADTHSLSAQTFSVWLTFDFSKIFDPIREALRRGILQPTLYE